MARPDDAGLAVDQGLDLLRALPLRNADNHIVPPLCPIDTRRRVEIFEGYAWQISLQQNIQQTFLCEIFMQIEA